MRNGRALPALLAVLLLAVCSVGAVSWEAEAIETGTSSAPLTELDCTFSDIRGTSIYVAVGAPISIQKEARYGASYVAPASGLTVSDGSITGTVAEAGSINITCYTVIDGGIKAAWPLVLNAVEQVEQTYYAYLCYDANGGSGAPSTQSASIYAVSASGSETFTIPSTQPTKSGYDFLGWSTSQSATVADLQSGDTVSVPYGSTETLYAVWKEKTYTSTLKFDANGGSGSPTTMTYASTSTSAHTFTIPTTEPRWTGHIFLGWSGSSDATSAGYQPGSAVSVPCDGSMTLYAVWENAQLVISTEPPAGSLRIGQSWSYAPSVGKDGCTVSVTGADWLSVSDGTISGTPTSAGTYDVTVTVSKDGYIDAVQGFRIKVYSTLGFDSDPVATGVFAYAERCHG